MSGLQYGCLAAKSVEPYGHLPKLDVAGSSPVARSIVMVKVVVGLKGIQYALRNHEDSGYEHDSQWRVGWIFQNLIV